jgi:Fic family protein
MDWLRLIRSEYLEMPGLRLTVVQAQRLWHMDRSTSTAMLGTLVDDGFLRRTDRGAYVRADAQ